MFNEYYSNGKLLLTGEYVVLDGYEGLALPTIYGQKLLVKTTAEKIINWTSYDYNNSVWFKNSYSIDNNGDIISLIKNDKISHSLLSIFKGIQTLNPQIFNSSIGYDFKTKLSFARNWGLGSSSTLISNLAKWANIDPYKLLRLTFGGSGYDIACSFNNKSILFNNSNNTNLVKECDFNPDFKEYIYFVYLGIKRNSQEAIKKYQNLKKSKSFSKSKFKLINYELINSTKLQEFENILIEHEKIISNIINQKTVRELLFKDYNSGVVKSLGAWGGDFILATGKLEDMNYFKSKGYNTIFKYKDLIKQ